MSTISAPSDVTFIDSEASLLSLLDSIANLVVNPPSLYISLEGIAQVNHGSISIMALYVAPTRKNYLIDIHSLGKTAFSATTKGGTSLKTILESSTIPKVTFDAFKLSHALFILFQVSVGGIKELQLMELAARTGSRQFGGELAECIEEEISISAAAKMEWHITRARARRLFAPRDVELNEIFNERPLKPEIIQYCKQGVMFLPSLYNVYSLKLRGPQQTFWRVYVRETTNDRIKMSQSPGYDGKSKVQTIGWNDETITEAMESWDEDIMMERMAGENMLNEEDLWVPVPSDDFDDL